jgi:hypothetical protein
MTIRKVDAYGASLGANTFTGAQAAPSLALGGAALSGNALAVTGTSAFGGNINPTIGGSIDLGTSVIRFGAIFAQSVGLGGYAPAGGGFAGTSLSLGGASGATLAVTGTAAISTSVSSPIIYNSAAGGVLFGAQSTTNFFGLNNWAANGTLQGRAGSVIGWGASTTNPDAAAPDSALSRISAGIIGVGTGGAGSIAGGLQAATLAIGGATLSGVVLAVTGSGAFSGQMSAPFLQTGPSGSTKTILSMTSNGSNYGGMQVEATAGTGAWSLSYNSVATSAIGTPALTWNGSGQVSIPTSLALGGATLAATFVLAATGNVQISGGNSLFFTNGSRIDDNNGSGLFRMFNAGASSGIGLGVATNGVLAVRTSNNGADGAITAAAATFSGALTVPGVTTAALTSTGTFTSGAGAQVGTLTNAPAAGNPTTWIKVIDNGVTRYIPAW